MTTYETGPLHDHEATPMATTSSHGQFTRLIDAVGYGDHESISVCHKVGAGAFTSAVVLTGEAQQLIDQQPETADVWNGVNPVAPGVTGRGTAADVVRLAALYADLDVKPGACPDLETAHTVIDEVSAILGTNPSAVVESGHGLQPYWPIEDGAIGDGFTTAQASALLRRFGRLVAAVAETRDVKVDNVFELARVLRVPGTVNNKDEPVPARLVDLAHPGGPLTIAEVDERLNEAGIYHRDGDDRDDTEVVVAPQQWTYGETTCQYVRSMIDGWCTDTPSARHPWLVSACVRLACAYRLGCLAEDDHLRAKKVLAERFSYLCATGQPPRAPGRYELADAWRDGVKRASCKSDAAALTELGGHEHHADAYVMEAPILNGQNNTPDDDDEKVSTIAWPVLKDTALHGTVGKIVTMIAPHTEADPAALLVQVLTVFGAMVGRGSYIRVANDEHPPILHPVIVGRTVTGAKGTSTGVVKAIVKIVDLDFFKTNVASGLSSDAGLIERVSDPVSDVDKNGDKIVVNPGTLDKRLLVIETEYGLVLTRGRRDTNPLLQVLRQAWDGDDLRTMNRKANSLTATRPHVVVIGHITPGEFRSTLRTTDFAGGSVNRLLICLSRRSRLHTRFGNVPDTVLKVAADAFSTSLESARKRGGLEFSVRFWRRWDGVYPELVRDRPDSFAVAAAGRAVPMVLRLAMIYALLDDADQIDADHLDAALALWDYCEHSIRWLFSTPEQESKQENGNRLANYVLAGGRDGRSRIELIRDYGKGHKKAAEINAELAPLIHDGIIIEQQIDRGGSRPSRHYYHRREVCEVAKLADQSMCANFADARSCEVENEPEVRNFAFNFADETPSDLATSQLRNFADVDNHEVSEVTNEVRDAVEAVVVECCYCSAGIPEHMHSQRARGYCGRGACVKAAANKDGEAQ